MTGKVDQEPLFGCTDCYEHVSLPASELRVYEDQCYCQGCWEYGDLGRDTDYSDLPSFKPAEQDLHEALSDIVSNIFQPTFEQIERANDALAKARGEK